MLTGVVHRRLTDSQIEFFKMVDEKVASVSVLNHVAEMVSFFITRTVLSQGEPRDAVVNFDTYRSNFTISR